MIEELYHSYQKELTAWCRGMTQNASLADDLVQEAFLRALINSQVLEHLRENQRRAWLYRTVKNLYLDRVRHSAYETAGIRDSQYMVDGLTAFYRTNLHITDSETFVMDK